MKSAKDIEQSIEKLAVESGDRVHDRVLDKLLKKLDQSKRQAAVEQASIWRRIMKSPVTKIAAAAVVIIMVMLFLHNGSVDMTTPAFGFDDVWVSMGKAEWVHMTWRWTQADAEPNDNENVSSESWISVNPRRNIGVSTTGFINFSEYADFKKELKSQLYDPQTNTITTTYTGDIVGGFLSDSIVNGFREEITRLESEGREVEFSDTIYNGRPAKTINIEMDATAQNGMHSGYSFVVDVATHLPRLLTLKRINPSGKTAIGRVEFSYPDSGPTDIFQAGAPMNAKVKVVDRRPSPDFLEVIKPYRAAKANLPTQRIVIDLENENDVRYRVCVIYTDGRKERFEQLMWVRNNVPPTTDDFEKILDWVRNARSDEFGAQLYDGECAYRSERDYRDRWKKSKRYSPNRKPDYVVGGLIHRGWPRIDKGEPVENSYATENNLLCIEKWSKAIVKENKLRRSTEKALYYIDPEHGYICSRIEGYKHFIVPQSYPEVDDLDFDPNGAPSEPYSVTEVTRFQQDDAGQWYPSEMTTNSRSWRHNGQGWEPEEERLVIRLFVETNPEFPEAIFDPDELPN